MNNMQFLPFHLETLMIKYAMIKFKASITPKCQKLEEISFTFIEWPLIMNENKRIYFSYHILDLFRCFFRNFSRLNIKSTENNPNSMQNKFQKKKILENLFLRKKWSFGAWAESLFDELVQKNWQK